MIQVKELSKRFGRKVAVGGVSFTAKDGCITGLLGPNGAGKSTTLRMVYGLIQPDSGSVSIDGMEVRTQPLETYRRIGVLSENRGLYSRLTGREHLRYFGRLQGLVGGDLQAGVDRTIGLLEMKEFADRRAGEFSQGERMRVSLGRTLIHDPQNILLDEPTNGLDVMSTRALRNCLVRLRGEGKCITFSSHVMQEVTALCDRVVVLREGKVVAEGTVAELEQATGRKEFEDAFVALTTGQLMNAHGRVR